MSSESSARDGTSSIIRVSIERRQGTPPLCLHDPAQAVRGEAEVLFVYHLLEGGDGRAEPPLVRPEISDFEDQLDDDGQDTIRCLLAVNEPPGHRQQPSPVLTSGGDYIFQCICLQGSHLLVSTRKKSLDGQLVGSLALPCKNCNS